MLEFSKNHKTFLNEGTKHTKIICKVWIKKIKILMVADPYNLKKT